MPDLSKQTRQLKPQEQRESNGPELELEEPP